MAPRVVALGPTPASSQEMRDMYVQLQDEDCPFAVKSIAGERQGDRQVVVVATDDSDRELRVPESRVQAAWHSPQPLPEPRIQTFKDLVLLIYPQEFADSHHQGYRFVVQTDHTLPHTAFKRAAELASWAAEMNLSLPAPAADLQEGGPFTITGQYHRATHCTTLSFDAVDGIRTRALDNGSVTAAQTVTDMATGICTLHVVGSNCTARETYETHAALLWPTPGEDVVVMARPDDRHALDEVLGWKEGVGPICRHTRMSLSELRQEYPQARMYTISEAADRIHRACCKPVEEISEDAFTEALGCLPPEAWVDRADTESFKHSEHYSGPITAIYARVDDRFFTLRDTCALSHDKIIERVRQSGLLDMPRLEFESVEPETRCRP